MTAGTNPQTKVGGSYSEELKSTCNRDVHPPHGRSFRRLPVVVATSMLAGARNDASRTASKGNMRETGIRE